MDKGSLEGQDQQDPQGEDTVPLYVWAGAFGFSFLCLGIYFYWSAFPLNNTIFLRGYFANNLPPSPSTYVEYSPWEYYILMAVSFNVFLYLCLVFSLLNNDIVEYANVHETFAGIFMLVNIGALAILTVRWIFFCNASWSADNTACNDYRYCGYYLTPYWCSNLITFVSSSGVLGRNEEMTAHWALTFIFTLLAYWNRKINADYRRSGLLRTR